MSKVQLSETSRYLNNVPGKKYIVYFVKDELIFHPSNRESPKAGTGETKVEAMTNALENLKGASNDNYNK